MTIMSMSNASAPIDEVIVELRRTKERLAEAMNFDVGKILEDARLKQEATGRPVLSPPARNAPPALANKGAP
jgi:hypothetical protein